MKYVGLTDDPEERKKAHGNPRDFVVTNRFNNEREARLWEKRMISRPGFTGGPGGKGWKFGYVYTITKNTKE